MVLGCAGFQARVPQGLTTGELSQGKQDLRLSPLRQWSSERVCDLPKVTQQVCRGRKVRPWTS